MCILHYTGYIETYKQHNRGPYFSYFKVIFSSKNVIQPMFFSSKLNEDLNVQEIKPTNVLFMLKCNLCDARYNYGVQSVPPAWKRLMVADRNRHPFTNTLQMNTMQQHQTYVPSWRVPTATQNSTVSLNRYFLFAIIHRPWARKLTRAC